MFLLIIAALLRPTRIFTEIREKPATLALLVDRSKSMQRVDGDVKRALAYLREVAEGKLRNDLDFYLTSSPYRGEAPQRIDESTGLGPSATLFYGAQTSRQLIEHYGDLTPAPPPVGRRLLGAETPPSDPAAPARRSRGNGPRHSRRHD